MLFCDQWQKSCSTDLALHFKLEHVIVFKQQRYMRQFTACSVLKKKPPTVTSLPLHFLHALLPRVNGGFVLFAFLLYGWERRTCADYFTESFHHNLSLCLSSLLMSSHCLPLQEVQSSSKLLWMPISRETLNSVSASNVSFSSFLFCALAFFLVWELPFRPAVTPLCLNPWRCCQICRRWRGGWEC